MNPPNVAAVQQGGQFFMRNSLLAGASVAAALLLAAVPAAATTWLVIGSGRAVQNPTPMGETRLEGVPFNDAPLSFAVLIDDSVQTFDSPGFGGIGSVREWRGGVIAFGVDIGGYAITPTQTATNLFFAIDNGLASGANRIDQVSFSQSTGFGPFSPSLETDAPLPAGAHIHAFTFGRTRIAADPPGPDLVTGLDLPPLDQLWVSGAPGMFLTFDVRQGSPTSVQQAATLPRARFGVTGLEFRVVALPDTPPVPEPASWALMITGFGLVGSALRRRVPSPA